MRPLRWLPLLLALLSGPAAAAWPDRPVRLVVPFAPGGTTDIIARLYVDFLRGRLPQPVLVENRPGAATNIGAELVARAEPDGTTLLLGAGLLVANPVWGPKPAFDTFTAFAPVSLITETQFLIAAGPRFAPRSPQALVALARREPRRHSISSAQLDVTVARLTRGMGIELEHVGYRGGAPAMTDAIAGQVDMVVALVPVLLPAVQQGQLTPIGVSGTQRSPVLPEVPSFAEFSFPAATETSWNAVLAPAGTPEAVISRLAAESRAFTEDPEMAARLRERGIEPRASSPAELAARLRREYQDQQELLRTLGPLGNER